MTTVPPSINDLMRQFFGGGGSLDDAAYAFYSGAAAEGYTAAAMIPFPTFISVNNPTSGLAEIQGIDFSGVADEGELTLALGDTVFDPILFDATEAEIQTIIDDALGADIAQAAGDLSTTLTVTWIPNGAQPTLTVDDNTLAVAAVPVEITVSVVQEGIDAIDVTTGQTWSTGAVLRVWRNDSWVVIAGTD